MQLYGPWKLFFPKATRLVCNLEILLSMGWKWPAANDSLHQVYIELCRPNILSHQCNYFQWALWADSRIDSTITKVCSMFIWSCQCSGFNLQWFPTQNHLKIILSTRQLIWRTPRRGHWGVRRSWARPNVWNRRFYLIQVSCFADWASARGALHNSLLSLDESLPDLPGSPSWLPSTLNTPRHEQFTI